MSARRNKTTRPRNPQSASQSDATAPEGASLACCFIEKKTTPKKASIVALTAEPLSFLTRASQEAEASPQSSAQLLIPNVLLTLTDIEPNFLKIQ